MQKKSKLSIEERAQEIIDRFYKTLNPLTNILPNLEIEEYAVLCAIELAKEAIFISEKDYNAEWSNRAHYWERILEVLKSKLV